MKKGLLSFIVAIFIALNANSQFTAADIQYWIGSGPDTTVLVVSFNDESYDHSYAWGYLHNSNVTAETMLNAIAAADVNFSVVINSGFLSDLIYNNHEGIGGSPNYWSTWSGNSFENMTTNMGISETLSNGSWFGCSYTDFNPALEPSFPLAAFDPFYFTADDITTWVGSGSDTTLVIIDFLANNGISSYAWGYLHNGSVSGETILNAIAAADPGLEIVITSGFLMDITYNGLSGIGGEPNYWFTWSATNLGNWQMNEGISTTFDNGSIFGCSYSHGEFITRPGYPVAAEFSNAVENRMQHSSISAYPNPATDVLAIQSTESHKQSFILFNMQGSVALKGETSGRTTIIDINHLPAGMYILQVGNTQKKISIQ